MTHIGADPNLQIERGECVNAIRQQAVVLKAMTTVQLLSKRLIISVFSFFYFHIKYGTWTYSNSYTSSFTSSKLLLQLRKVEHSIIFLIEHCFAMVPCEFRLFTACVVLIVSQKTLSFVVPANACRLRIYRGLLAMKRSNDAVVHGHLSLP